MRSLALEEPAHRHRKANKHRKTASSRSAGRRLFFCSFTQFSVVSPSQSGATERH